MRFLSAIHYPEWTLRRRLFGYMLLLVVLLLLVLMAGLLLFGRFHSTEQDTYDTLDIQMDSFEKDLSTFFDHLAAASIQISESMSAILDEYLLEHQITMSELTNTSVRIAAIQEAMIEPLRLKLLQEDCSGVFVLLDATINSSLDDADTSKAGLYLQTNGYDTYAQNVLLYRGFSDIAKQHDIMPHRKWRLEFNTNWFPSYQTLLSLTELPVDEAYFLTELHTLPGTSEQVMLMVVPMLGSDGTFYGFCGCEVSASYFMAYLAQPTRIPHLTCLLTAGNRNELDASSGLSCGVSGGYYRAPKGILSTKQAAGELICFTGDASPYIGVLKNIALTPNNGEYTLSVMVPKEDFDQDMRKTTLQNILLWLLILFFTVNCCLFFSRRFLTPILKGLEELKSEHRAQSHIPEIDDLFAFLSEKDREYEETLRVLTQEKQHALSETERLMDEYEKARIDYQTAKREISRLSYRIKQEIDPEQYQYFCNGLRDLTPTERKIFNLYFDGRTAKEILELLQIKENTLKFHNKGIYSKLGVSSRKQLLQYAALMKQTSAEDCPVY